MTADLITGMIGGAFITAVGIWGCYLWVIAKAPATPGMDEDRGYRPDDCSDFDGPA